LQAAGIIMSGENDFLFVVLLLCHVSGMMVM
jgi:hypothetical protein